MMCPNTTVPSLLSGAIPVCTECRAVLPKGRRKFCSRKCINRHNRRESYRAANAPVSRACKQCGDVFKARPKNRRAFCSDICQVRHRNALTKRKRAAARRKLQAAQPCIMCGAAIAPGPKGVRTLCPRPKWCHQRAYYYRERGIMLPIEKDSPQ